MNKLKVRDLLVGAACVLGLVLLAVLALRKENVNVKVNVERESPLGMTFTSPGSNLTELAVANDLTVGDELTVTATSSLGYAPNQFTIKSTGLTDATTTMASICNADGQQWHVRAWELLIPGGTETGARDITVGTTTSATMGSSTEPKHFGLAAAFAYTPSVANQLFAMDFATSSPVADQTAGARHIVQTGECLNVAINRAASSTGATNLQGRFLLRYFKWPPSS